MQLSSQNSEILLDLAADLIRRELTPAPRPPVFPQDPVLRQPAGCFVSLHEHTTHNLRGCIGTLQSDRPLLETLAAACTGVLKDPRFTHHPVTIHDLPQLELEITVLEKMQPVPTPLDFEPRTHGIYLKINERAGCFLPQVARETGWTREQLLARLCTEKLGLPPESWRSPAANMAVFNAQVIGPRPFFPG
ncbi:MAG: AmmeMemoRadiSam system protein A [Tepidisphaeraceae bacterium]|jgi:AmmeMemoRadiSam system protein A